MPWDDTGPLHDRYDRWGGAALPAYGVVDTAANDIEATAYVYRFLHANGSYYAVRVANVPSSDAAANWLADWRQRWLTRDADSGYRDVTEVPVGPAMGSDDSALVAYAWTASDGKVRRGYAVAFRIGTAVVETQIHTANGLPRSLAVGLLNRQFACFAARTCIEPDAFLLLRMPGLYVPAVPAAPST
jgi:hypothetical protein